MELKSTTQISSDFFFLPATPSSQLHGKQNVHSEGCYFECHQRPAPTQGGPIGPKGRQGSNLKINPP